MDDIEKALLDQIEVNTTQPGKNGHLKIFIYAESILRSDDS